MKIFQPQFWGQDYIFPDFSGTDAYLKWSDGNLYLMTDEGTNSESHVRIQGKGTGPASLILIDGDSSNYWGGFKQDGTVFQAYFGASTTEFAINEAGLDVDFRVESNTNENMFFVDGGNGVVIVGSDTSTRTAYTFQTNIDNGNAYIQGGVTDNDTATSQPIFVLSAVLVP